MADDDDRQEDKTSDRAEIEALRASLSQLQARLDREHDDHVRENERIRAELAPKKDEKKEKPVTRAQLRRLVEEGRLTSEEADDEWERQLRLGMEREMEERVNAAVAGALNANKTTSIVERYRAVRPELDKQDSEDRRRLLAEFEYLVNSTGMDRNDERTTIAALRAAFGPVEVLERNKPQQTFEAHSEVGGSGDTGDADDTKGMPKGLSSGQRRYYQDAINKGVYRDWKHVSDEIKYANKGTQARARARNG